MSTAHWQARRLPIPSAWPVHSSPAAHPWAIISAGLAPILLTGAYLIAGILQPASYSPVRTTISAMAGQAAGTGSRRPCQWAVLTAADPARAGDPASAHQAMRTRPLLPPRLIVPGPVTFLPCAARARQGLGCGGGRTRGPPAQGSGAMGLLGGRLRRILGAGLDSFLGPSSSRSACRYAVTRSALARCADRSCPPRSRAAAASSRMG